jgi:hypothetical protein
MEERGVLDTKARGHAEGSRINVVHHVDFIIVQKDNPYHNPCCSVPEGVCKWSVQRYIVNMHARMSVHSSIYLCIYLRQVINLAAPVTRAAATILWLTLTRVVKPLV